MDCINILDGQYQIVHVTPDLYDETEELLADVSVNHELTCLAAKVKDSPLAMADLRAQIRYVLSGGISFAVRHVSSGRIVAAIANIIFHEAKDTIYELTEYKCPKMIKYMQLWEALEASYNIYKEWNMPAIFDVQYLATHLDFRCRGLAFQLFKHSMDFARLLSQEKLPLEEHNSKDIPKGVMTMATSPYSRKCGYRLGLEIVKTWHISEREVVELQAIKF
ncbi:uncharacterized protein LOC117897161 isoform X1 [Drosophila subobscura]|uniref:uncharacterized protein LOC117897161 isoform X1 n=1 Tax=Drosophila subobscura TaxID=7241 RepID=UPI00155A5D48|nr:uncharacterized protein LOC117897161 isoform X1 [Drosophila subobscura]